MIFIISPSPQPNLEGHQMHLGGLEPRLRCPKPCLGGEMGQTSIHCCQLSWTLNFSVSTPQLGPSLEPQIDKQDRMRLMMRLRPRQRLRTIEGNLLELHWSSVALRQAKH